MFKALKNLQTYLIGQNVPYKKSVDKIFENINGNEICVVDFKEQNTKTISKKDFFKILSL